MNKTIHYEDLIYRNKQIDNLKQKGFIIIPKKKCRIYGYITTYTFHIYTFIYIGLWFIGFKLSKCYG